MLCRETPLRKTAQSPTVLKRYKIDDLTCSVLNENRKTVTPAVAAVTLFIDRRRSRASSRRVFPSANENANMRSGARRCACLATGRLASKQCYLRRPCRRYALPFLTRRHARLYCRQCVTWFVVLIQEPEMFRGNAQTPAAHLGRAYIDAVTNVVILLLKSAVVR
ncbi:hypothetical protein LSAT2_015468 [Lamellibrachia satsuma]|nr:hypothetical protein LSAT2_015468 [Lamellibrachia satsuma]